MVINLYRKVQLQRIHYSQEVLHTHLVKAQKNSESPIINCRAAFAAHIFSPHSCHLEYRFLIYYIRVFLDIFCFTSYLNQPNAIYSRTWRAGKWWEEPFPSNIQKQSLRIPPLWTQETQRLKNHRIYVSFLFSLSTDAITYGLLLIFRARVVGSALFQSSGDGDLWLSLRDALGWDHLSGQFATF